MKKLAHHIAVFGVLPMIMLALFGAVALAAAGAGADPQSGDLLNTGLEAITRGQWWILAGAALSGVHILLGKIYPELVGADGATPRHDFRAYIMVFVLALIGGFGHAFLAGADASLATVKLVLPAAIKVAATAVFGYVGVKKAAQAARQGSHLPD